MKLVISIECNSSLTRIIYKFWNSQNECTIGYFTMHSVVEEVSEQIINERCEYFGKVRSAESKRLACLKVENKHFLVGELTQKFACLNKSFNITDDRAIYKVLAALGVVLRENNVKIKSPIPVLVGVLLSWNEYSDRAWFKKRLVELLNSYEFGGETIKIGATTKSILVQPFGKGLALAHLFQQGKEFLKGKKIGIAIFRNDAISGLVVDNGLPSFGETQKIGLSYFLDLVIESANGIDRQNLLKAINNAIKESEIDKYTNKENLISDGFFYLGKCSFPNWEKVKAIDILISSFEEINKAKELKDICHILDRASKKYRAKVREWLEKTFPVAEFYCLIISGEAVKFLQQEIEEYCDCYRPIHFDDPILFLDEGCYKYQYKQQPLFEPYYSLPNNTAYIKLISDRELAIVISQALGLNEINREELAQHNLSVDNLGIFQYLLKQEKQYQTKRRSRSALKTSTNSIAEKDRTIQVITKARAVEIETASLVDSQNIFVEPKTAQQADCLPDNTVVRPKKAVQQADYSPKTLVEPKTTSQPADYSPDTFVEIETIQQADYSPNTFVEPKKVVRSHDSPKTVAEQKKAAESADYLPQTVVKPQATELYHSPKTFVEPKQTTPETADYSPKTLVEPKKLVRLYDSPQTVVKPRIVEPYNSQNTLVEPKTTSQPADYSPQTVVKPQTVEQADYSPKTLVEPKTTSQPADYSPDTFVEIETIQQADYSPNTFVEPKKVVRSHDSPKTVAEQKKAAESADYLPQTVVKPQATELYHSPKTFVEPKQTTPETADYSPKTLVEPKKLVRLYDSPQTVVKPRIVEPYNSQNTLVEPKTTSQPADYSPQTVVKPQTVEQADYSPKTLVEPKKVVRSHDSPNTFVEIETVQQTVEQADYSPKTLVEPKTKESSNHKS